MFCSGLGRSSTCLLRTLFYLPLILDPHRSLLRPPHPCCYDSRRSQAVSNPTAPLLGSQESVFVSEGCARHKKLAKLSVVPLSYSLGPHCLFEPPSDSAQKVKGINPYLSICSSLFCLFLCFLCFFLLPLLGEPASLFLLTF